MVGWINIIKLCLCLFVFVEWNKWLIIGILFNNGILDIFFCIFLLIKLFSIIMLLLLVIMVVLIVCLLIEILIVVVLLIFDIFCLIVSCIVELLLICGVILSFIFIFWCLIVWNGFVLFEFVCEFVIIGIFWLIIIDVFLLFMVVIDGVVRMFELVFVDIVWIIVF